MSQPSDFEHMTALLAEQSLDLAGLQAVLHSARQALPNVDSVAHGHGDRNAYRLIDRVVVELNQAFPDSLCHRGCGRCCELHRALIRVFRSEWEAMVQHLQGALSRGELDGLIARFYVTYDPYLPLLHDLQTAIDAGDRPKPTASELPISCPLLVEDMCAVYPLRPGICRGYGHFELTDATGDRTEVFACREQQAVLSAQLGTADGPRAHLPSFNPFYQAIAGACEGEEKLLIPLWFERTFPRPER